MFLEQTSCHFGFASSLIISDDVLTCFTFLYTTRTSVVNAEDWCYIKSQLLVCVCWVWCVLLTKRDDLVVYGLDTRRHSSTAQQNSE